MISHNKPYQIYNILTKKSRCPQGIAGIRTLLNFGTQESINYGNTARIIYGDGLVVDITHNSGGVLMAEINDESSSDAAVTTALWLVTKAIDDEISDEELDKAINELRQGDYTYYTPLTLHNLKCSYQTQLLSNGETRYEVVLVGN